MKRIVIAALLALTAFRARVETAPEPLSVTLTAGYDSRYLLYGYRLNRHLLKADAYLAYTLNEKTTLWGGSWFGLIPDGTYREIDAYIGINRALGGGFSVGAAVSAFYYIEVPFSDKDLVYELLTHATYFHERFSLSLKDHLDTESDGHLLRAIATVPMALTDRVRLEGTAEYGYAFGYYIDGDKPNHALLKLAAPIALSEAVYLTPHITRSIALDAIEAFERDDTILGASISWSF